MAWKPLLRGLAALGLVLAVISWVVEGVTPSWVVFPILLIIGLARARGAGPSGTVWLGLSALVFLIVHLPFVKAALEADCVNPADSDRACHPAWWLISVGLFPLVMVVVAVFAFREAGGTWRVPRLRR